MTPKISPPPKDLNSFQGRKWLESLTAQGEDITGIAGLEFLLLVANALVPNSRVLVGSSNILITDGGPGGNLVLNLANSGVSVGSYTKVSVSAKGVVTAGSAATTSDIPEGGNLYYTDARAIAAIPTNLSLTSLAVKAGAAAGNTAKVGGTIFDHYTDVGNGTTVETDLYSDSILANTLSLSGEKLKSEYGGSILGHATATRQIKVYFGGTIIFDSTALAVVANNVFSIDVSIIAVSSSVVRYRVVFSIPGISFLVVVGELTGLTLSAANILKITGQAGGVGAATNDIVAKMGTVEWKAAA
jgi:hypothetical protein